MTARWRRHNSIGGEPDHDASHMCAAGVALFAALVVVATASAGPTGACCFTDAEGAQDCDILSAAACAALVPPGVYQGDDTSCGLCAFVDCAQDEANCQMANIPQFPGGTILTADPTRDNFVPTVTTDITSLIGRLILCGRPWRHVAGVPAAAVAS